MPVFSGIIALYQVFTSSPGLARWTGQASRPEYISRHQKAKSIPKRCNNRNLSAGSGFVRPAREKVVAWALLSPSESWDVHFTRGADSSAEFIRDALFDSRRHTLRLLIE